MRVVPLLLLVLGCGRVALPVVPDAAGALAIEVTRDGRVFVDGRASSIHGLLRALEESGAPVDLRADRDAAWAHVQWVLAAAGESGRTSVRCVVRTGEGEGALDVPVYAGRREDRIWTPWVDLSATVTVQQNAYVLATGLGESREVALDLDALRAWTGSRGARVPVEAKGDVPYHRVVAAIAAVGEADVGLEALHPWDRELEVLPPPPDDFPIARWVVTDLSEKPLYPMNLPVARMAEGDKGDDPDDRVILNLTADGRLRFGEEPVTLAELRERLAAAAEAYERKREAVGGSGYVEDRGRRWSQLYVLLRADRDARWGDVRDAVRAIRAAGFFKLQFGATRDPEPRYAPGEAERSWAGRHVRRFPYTLDRKLHCWTSTLDAPDPATSFVDVRVASGRFRHGDRETASAEDLAAWLRAVPQEGRTIGRIHAPPGTRFQEVATAIDAFHAARIEQIDLE